MELLELWSCCGVVELWCVVELLSCGVVELWCC